MAVLWISCIVALCSKYLLGVLRDWDEINWPEEAREIIRRIELVRTPPHGSWLNIAELELSHLTRLGLDNRIDTKGMLERKVKDWYQMRNDKIAKVNWTFTSKDARIKLKRLYPSFET